MWRPLKRKVTLSQHIGLVACHIYFWYNATSGCIIDNTIELHDLGKMTVAVGILLTPVMQTKTAFTSGLGGCHMYFRYNATSGRVGDNVIEPGDVENMDIIVGV